MWRKPVRVRKTCGGASSEESTVLKQSVGVEKYWWDSRHKGGRAERQECRSERKDSRRAPDQEVDLMRSSREKNRDIPRLSEGVISGVGCWGRGRGVRSRELRRDLL